MQVSLGTTDIKLDTDRRLGAKSPLTHGRKTIGLLPFVSDSGINAREAVRGTGIRNSLRASFRADRTSLWRAPALL